MENARPTFLTILCVLTFLGSAMGIFNGITNYTSADMVAGVTQEAMEEVQDKIDAEAQDERSSAIINKIFDSVGNTLTPDKIRSNAIGSGIASLLTLLGAILMWGLDKKGYFLYIIGTVVGIAVPIFVYQGFVGALAGSGIAFIGIIFAILYSVNLKHLK